ncbi:hypothetical protein [Prescottella agglutinans]|uniref:hypothetical protein n=1 Tax=Prescottella agglutinans TaxID=1644129 RepID=UPI003D98C3D3
MDVDTVADELYRLDPSDFVAARAAFVKQARAAKERDTAVAIAGLKKPTTVGWLVNLLAQQCPDDVNAVLSLGDALNRAQRRLDAETLRELTEQRQRLVRALATRAGALAADRGRTVNETVLRQVSQTLHAAMVDPVLAGAVRQGRAVAAVSYSGFGPAGLESVDAGADGSEAAARAAAARARPGRRVRDREKVLERARAELRSAREEARQTRTALDEAETDLAAIRSDAAEAADRVGALRRELGHLEERVEFLARSEASADRAVSAARDDVDRADRRVAEAEDAVSALE